MDIYCPVCAEPWEIDTLHDVADEIGGSFRQVRELFRQRGCQALGTSHGSIKANPIIGELMDLAGDDIDGFAADMDDFLYLGLELHDGP